LLLLNISVGTLNPIVFLSLGISIEPLSYTIPPLPKSIIEKAIKEQKKTPKKEDEEKTK
jgi:hypothetical protein